MTFIEEMDMIFTISKYNPLFKYLYSDLMDKVSLLRENKDYTDNEINCFIKKLESLNGKEYNFENLFILETVNADDQFGLEINLENTLECRKLLQCFYKDYKIFNFSSLNICLDKIMSGISKSYTDKSEEFWVYYHLLLCTLKFNNFKELNLNEKQINYIISAIKYGIDLQNNQLGEIFGEQMSYFGDTNLYCRNGDKISLTMIKTSLQGENCIQEVIDYLDSFYNIEENDIGRRYVNDLISFLRTDILYHENTYSMFDIFSLYSDLSELHMIDLMGIIPKQSLENAFLWICSHFERINNADLYMYINDYIKCRIKSMSTKFSNEDCFKYLSTMKSLIDKFDINYEKRG